MKSVQVVRIILVLLEREGDPVKHLFSTSNPFTANTPIPTILPLLFPSVGTIYTAKSAQTNNLTYSPV